MSKGSLSHKSMGFIFAIIASTLYAMNSVLGKLILMDGVTAWSLVFYQNLFSFLIVSAYLLFKGKSYFRINRIDITHCIKQGIFGAFATSMLFYLSLTYLNAGIAAMLLFTNPIFITLFYAISGEKRLRIHNYVALLLSMAGTALVLDVFSLLGMSLEPLGIVLGIASAITYAFYNIYADKHLTKLEPFTILFYTMACCLVLSFITVMGIEKGIPGIPLNSLFKLILVALLSGVLPVVFFYRSIALIGSENTSIISTTEIPLTLLIAFLLIGEQMGIVQLIGVFAIIAASVLLHRSQ